LDNIEINNLEWDSDFFNLSVGKIDISPMEKIEDLSKLKKLILKSKYDLLYIFSDISQYPLLEFKGISPIHADTHVYLRMDMPSEIEPIEYKLLTVDNISLMNIKVEDLYEISDQIAPVSRFYNDPGIKKKKVIELYRRFIQNSLNGSFGKGLITERNPENKVISLISIDSIDTIGREILIGVNRSYRGKHSGERIFTKSLNYWKDRGIKEIETVVSVRNLKSLDFHLKLGFKIYKIRNVYHLWIQD